MPMIDQVLRIKVNGQNETENFATGSVSRTKNRLYDVVTLDAAYEVETHASIEATVGDFVFNGFVYSVEKTGPKSYSVECRSNNAKMTTPFVQAEDTYDEAQTSSALWDYYEERYGVTITSSEVDLYFGQNFRRNGTPLSAVSSVCDVTGSTFWDNGDGISIVPSVPFTEKGRILFNNDIFELVIVRNDIDNDGLHRVVINESRSFDGSNPESPSCSVRIDVKSDKTVIMYPSNTGALSSTRGIVPDFTSWNYFPLLTYEGAIKGTEVFLDTATNTINSVKVDGISVGYTHADGTDSVVFSSEQRGFVQIQYVGIAFKAKAETINIGGGDYYEIDAKVCDEWKYKQGKVPDRSSPENGIGDPTGNTDGILIITPDRMNYEKGFSILTSADVNFEFFEDGVVTALQVSESTEMYTRKMTAYAEEGSVIHIRYPVDSVVGVKQNGIVISHTKSTDANGNTLLQLPGGMSGTFEVVYSFNANKYDIHGSHRNGQVTMNVIDPASGKFQTYYLEKTNPDNICDVPGVFPATIPIDVAEQLNVPIGWVAGKSFAVTKNGLAVGTFQTDWYGMMYVTLNENGTYDVDTSEIIKSSRMVITAGV